MPVIFFILAPTATGDAWKQKQNKKIVLVLLVGHACKKRKPIVAIIDGIEMWEMNHSHSEYCSIQVLEHNFEW